MRKKVYESNAPTQTPVLWCDAITMFQINADAVNNGLTRIPASREVHGIALSGVVTPLGVVYLYLGECLPAGTALLLNLDVISPVYQPVPGKGNFFLDSLAKSGHSENGINRSYEAADVSPSLLKQIVPVAGSGCDAKSELK